jgi:hypothetical protein
VAINKDIVARGGWVTITGDGTTTVFPVPHGLLTSKVFAFAINDTTGEMENVAWKRNATLPTSYVDITITPAPANGLVYTIGFIAVAGS